MMKNVNDMFAKAMRYMAVIAFLMMATLVMAQRQKEYIPKHMTFEGIEITGKAADFVEKLEKKGFYVTRQDQGDCYYMRRNSGWRGFKDCYITVSYSPKSRTVSRVAVYIYTPDPESLYDYFKEKFKEEYLSGRPGTDNDNYSFQVRNKNAEWIGLVMLSKEMNTGTVNIVMGDMEGNGIAFAEGDQ